MHPPRIASLVPSVTELVVALGLAPRLVARTGFCIHPREALAGVPKVGGTKDVDLGRLQALAPTHVVLNIDENRAETAAAIAAWGRSAPQLVITHPQAPEDNLALVDQLAAVFAGEAGVAGRAQALKRELASELALTGPANRERKRVLYLIWRDPWMSVARDTYLSRMLARVNWQTLPEVDGGERGSARYPRLQGDEPWLAAVDLLLLSSEPYRFSEADLAAAQALAPQAAVRRVDGELLSWYGPRAVPGLAYLRALADGRPAASL